MSQFLHANDNDDNNAKAIALLRVFSETANSKMRKEWNLDKYLQYWLLTQVNFLCISFFLRYIMTLLN